MIALTMSSTLLVMWISFMAVGLMAGTVVFIWAVRARQFANQDRARRLALESGIPRDDAPAAGQGPKGKS